jgi:DNA-binding MarR family transcriptional regulator
MDTARYVEKIATLFGKILASIQLDATAESMGLTPSQFQGLSYLFHHGESSIGEIAYGLGTTHPAAVKLVDRLRKKGFVQRTESKTDRRISLIELTEQGRQLAEDMLTSRTAMLAQALSRMEPSELEGVMRGLEALLAAALDGQKDVKSVCLRCGDDHIGCCIVNRTHLELTGTTIEKT